MANSEGNKIKTLQVRLDSNLYDKAKDKAKDSGLSLSQTVRKLLEQYISDSQITLNF